MKNVKQLLLEGDIVELQGGYRAIYLFNNIIFLNRMNYIHTKPDDLIFRMIAKIYRIKNCNCMTLEDLLYDDFDDLSNDEYDIIYDEVNDTIENLSGNVKVLVCDSLLKPNWKPKYFYGYRKDVDLKYSGYDQYMEKDGFIYKEDVYLGRQAYRYCILFNEDTDKDLI